MEIDAKKFGHELAALRDVRRLKQEVVAKKTGLTVNYISLLENGQRSPSIDAINRLAKALDVPAQLLAFLGGRHPSKRSPMRELIVETETAVKLAICADQELRDSNS